MTTAAATRNLPFDNGDNLSRAEFHRLYSACEGLEHVELIEGVVYLPSPTRFRGHSREQLLVLVWLDTYASKHSGLEASSPTSILLDDDNEPEPDAVLFREREDTYQDDYLAVAPELIVEIAASSAARDLHQKKAAYERNGVKEYVVWRTRDNAIDWFRLVDGHYQVVAPDAHGIIESAEFPSLRLDVPAMLAKDRERVLAALAG